MLSFLALPLMLVTATAPQDLSASDFASYCRFETLAGKDDVKGLSRDKQVAKVSKAMKLKPKQLEAVLSKGDGAGGSCEKLAKSFEEKARAALAGTPMEKRVKDFYYEVNYADDGDTYVVAYGVWSAEQPKRLEEEASLIAWAVGSTSPMVKVLSVRATEAQNEDNSMFEGKISAENMKKIDKTRIDSFADARYAKLFEKTK
jgi:hypothetical protein